MNIQLLRIHEPEAVEQIIDEAYAIAHWLDYTVDELCSGAPIMLTPAGGHRQTA